MSKLLGKTMKSSKMLLVMALCFMIVGTTLVIPVKAYVGEVSNSILSLKIQENPDKAGYAGFMLTKAGEENSEYLTYSKFYSSYTTITINGVSYRYSQGEVVEEIHLAEDGSVVSAQGFDGIEVWQKLEFSTGNSSREDTLKVTYSVDNKTNNDVLISTRIVIDPTLNKSETDMIQVEGKSYNVEETFSGSEVPDEWFIRDGKDTITAYGKLKYESVNPDKFQIVDWNNIYNNTSEYTTSKDVIKDNAVAICWDNKTIKAGENFDFGTKYGLYSEDEPVVEEYTSDSIINSEPEADGVGQTQIETESNSTDIDEETTTAKKTYDKSSTSPKTGEVMRLSFAFLMFIASGLCIAMYIFVERKERRVRL